MDEKEIKIACRGADTLPIEKIIPFQGELKSLTETNYKKLKKQIIEHGFSMPLAVWEDGDKYYCLDGHQRDRVLKTLQSEGWKVPDIPVVYIEAADRKEAKIKLLSFVSQYGKVEGQGLYEFVTDAGLAIDDLEDSFEMPDIDLEEFKAEYTDDKAGLTDPDDVPEPPAEPVSKLGEIYQLGQHRLMCGDSTKEEDLNSLMGREKSKLLFTSAPYNTAGDYYYQKQYKDKLKSDEYIDFNIRAIKNAERYMTGFVFWNISYNKNSRWEWIEIFYRIIKETKFRFLENIIWDKGHGFPLYHSKEGLTRQYENVLVLGDEADIARDLESNFVGNNEREFHFNKKTMKGLTNYWRIDSNKSQTKELKACFPVYLVTKAILVMTSNGDSVMDIFAGSGSTLIACEKAGRRSFNMELSPRYIDLIIKRWEAFTGNKAVLVGSADKSRRREPDVAPGEPNGKEAVQ